MCRDKGDTFLTRIVFWFRAQNAESADLRWIDSNMEAYSEFRRFTCCIGYITEEEKGRDNEKKMKRIWEDRVEEWEEEFRCRLFNLSGKETEFVSLYTGTLVLLIWELFFYCTTNEQLLCVYLSFFFLFCPIFLWKGSIYSLSSCWL